MSFESGSVTFRMFYLQQPLPTDHVERFARRALPPISTLGDTPISGWVTGRHLMDNNINDETAHYAGYLRLALTRAERVIPATTLRAECRMEELARMMAQGRAELDRHTRSEIRKEIEARLLPGCAPQFKGMTLVHLPGSDIVLCEAISDKQVDALEAAFREAVGFGLIPVTPYNAAACRRKVDVRDLEKTSFSSDCDDDACDNRVGQDFLTWFWFYSEDRGGIFKTSLGDDFAVMVEAPLTFVKDGQGAHVAVLSHGNPVISTEAKIALLSGKKLSKAKILLARGQDTWQCTLGAEEFIYRGLKLPAGEKLDPISRFQERIEMITFFTTSFLEMFDQFLAVRLDSAAWKKEVGDIRNWVTGRIARK